MNQWLETGVVMVAIAAMYHLGTLMGSLVAKVDSMCEKITHLHTDVESLKRGRNEEK